MLDEAKSSLHQGLLSSIFCIVNMNFKSGDWHCVQTSTSRGLPIGVQQEVWETTCEDLQVELLQLLNESCTHFSICRQEPKTKCWTKPHEVCAQVLAFFNRWNRWLNCCLGRRHCMQEASPRDMSRSAQEEVWEGGCGQVQVLCKWFHGVYVACWSI